MNNQRETFINEMFRMEEAILKTKSKYLRNDYIKALKRMKKELQEYDEFQKGSKKIK